MTSRPAIAFGYATMAAAALVTDTDVALTADASSSIALNANAWQLPPGHVFLLQASFGATFDAATADGPVSWVDAANAQIAGSSIAQLKPTTFATDVEASFGAIALVNTLSATAITTVKLRAGTVAGTVTLADSACYVFQVA